MKTNDLPDMLVEASKSAPPVAVTGITMVGISLSDWVLIATLTYTFLQMGWFVWDKLIRPRRDRAAAAAAPKRSENA